MEPSPERLLLDLVAAQSTAYGREDSFKMSQGRLLAGRFLVGLRTTQISASGALAIAAGIGMPEKFREPFLAHLADADVVLFGLEDGESGFVHKAYLEFWEKVRRKVVATRSREPELLNLGFKWYAGEGNNSVVSRYTCYPMLDLAGMIGRIRGLYPGTSDAPSCQLGLHAVQLAARRRAACIYMEVSEEGTSRRSYDMNLYKADLTLEAIEPALRQAAARYAVPGERFEALYSRVHGRPLGHLSGGVARDGSDFLTVYYETQPL
jgi:hypothetical protein